ncbi:thioesterase [Actinoplanes sp. NBRC 14428]|nr:thioesterase [Actinoplanes sp. NBRC 14428]
MDARSSAWLRRYLPADEPRSRLVCLPHAGGSASYFLPTARALGTRADVLAVQYPGRQDRRGEPPVDTVGELADRIAEVLLPLTDLPLVLFGHSLGATIAFEVAVRLEAAGIRPASLFASGRRAPSTHRVERVHTLDDEGLLADLRRLGGTDQAVLDGDREIQQMVLPAIRSDYRAAETYRWVPGPPLTCPVIALRGNEDPLAGEAETLAWQWHTTGGFTMRSFPGGHFFPRDHAEEINRLIGERLAGVAAR